MTVALSEADLLALVEAQLADYQAAEEMVEEFAYTPGDLAGLRLRNDNVAVRVLPAPEETASGIRIARPKKVPCTQCHKKGNGKCQLCHGSILMLNPNAEQLVEAEVLAVGPGYYTERGVFVPMELEVGDIVLVKPDAGDPYAYTKDVRIVRAGSDWQGENGEYRPGEIWGVVDDG